jgi:hypothetical protein
MIGDGDYRLLQKAGFGPEDTKRMGDAYEIALAELGIKDRNDPLTETVAKFIFEVAQMGAKDPHDDLRRALSLLRVRGDRKAG